MKQADTFQTECFFCQDDLAEVEAKMIVPMYRIVKTSGPVTAFLSYLKYASGVIGAVIGGIMAAKNNGTFPSVLTGCGVGGGLGALMFMFHPDNIVEYIHSNICIPRCKQCKALHDNDKWLEKEPSITFKLFSSAVFGATLGVLIHIPFFFMSILSKKFNGMIWFLYFAVIGALLLLGIHSLCIWISSLFPKPNIRAYWKEYPEVEKLLAEKWKYGMKPEEKRGVKCIYASDNEINDLPDSA
ncbi:MAG: hypothetical protein ACYTFK_05120 [Planctomycetota bacterium]